MVLRICLSLVFLVNSCLSVNGQDSIVFLSRTIHPIDTLQPDSLKLENKIFSLKKKKVKPKRRIIAALLCVTLGPFGMHRLYLGTKPHVAAAYTVTLGGGVGIVPVIDLFQIVFSKDISQFKENDQFFMWVKQ
jgi:TM2 domain-containing membrane protein YozV